MKPSMYGWHRRHDQKAHRRSFIVSPPLLLLSAYLGRTAYQTWNHFPFNAGTTMLLGGLSALAAVLALLILFGVIVLDSGNDSSYYY